MTERCGRMLALTIVTLLLAGCGGLKLWPFGDGKKQQANAVYKPENSTAYVCKGNKKFFVRMLDKGNTAWVILPQREVALAKVAGEAGRYSNGISVLSITGDEASLAVSESSRYVECKALAD